MTENYKKPRPEIDALTRPWWDALAQNRLTLQHCCDCGHLHFPPGPVCPRCLSDKQDWQTASGAATLLTWAKFHRAYWPAYADELPYDVCVVRLDEGPLLASNFATPAPGEATLQAWHSGMRMHVVFEAVASDLTLPRFRADPASASIEKSSQ